MGNCMAHMEQTFTDGRRYCLTGRWVTLYDSDGVVHCRWIYIDDKTARREFFLRVEEYETILKGA